MKIKTHTDQTIRSLLLRAADADVLDLGLNRYRSRKQHFQVEQIHIRVEFAAGQPEIQNVRVSGPLVKKDGSHSDTVRDDDSWYWHKRETMPAWLALVVVNAVDGLTEQEASA